MNDRFRFRAFDKKEQQLYYDAEDTYDCLTGKPYPICASSFGSLLDNDNWIVEQCTCLKDKNGKLIYEGDICIPAKDMADNAGEVYRSESGAYFIKGKMKDGTEYDFGIYWHHYMYEVIGNIHENADLIKVGRK